MKKIQTVLMLVLVVAAAFGFKQRFSTQDDTATLAAEVFPAVEPLLPTEEGGKLPLVLASVLDCPVCLKEADYWRDLSRNFGSSGV